MKEQIFLFLSQSRYFWKVNGYFEKHIFNIDKRKLSISSDIFRIKQDIPYYKEITRYSVKPLLLVVCFAILLQSSNSIVHEFKPDIKIFFAYNLGWRPNFRAVSDSEYVTFLTAISAIGGLFIGLYHAALSSIQSALYSKLPNNIRNLLSAEKSGNVYMRFLAYTTFLSLCLIAFRLVGFERIYVAPFVMSFLGAIAIFAFVGLGKKAFNLFDPTVLAESIFANLSYLARDATVNGKYFKRKEFQQYCNKLAHNEIVTLATLYDFALKQKKFNDDGLLKLNAQSMRFLSWYVYKKQQIQTTSLWFDQTHLHKDWYRLDNHNIYSSAGVTPPPEKTSNLLWIEERIQPYVLKSLALNLQLGRYQIVFNMMSQIEEYLQILAFELEAEALIEFYSKLKQEILAHIFATNNSEIKPEILFIIDRLSSMKINIFLAFAQKILSNNLIDDNRLKSIDWLHSKDIYKHGFEVYLLESLEFLHQTISYEYAIEGKIITPYWFQNEVIKRVKTKKFAEGFKTLLADDLFLIPSALNEKAWYKAAYIARQWEYYQKIFANFTYLEKTWNNLKSSRKIDYTDWGEIDIEDLKLQLAVNKQIILESMGNVCMQLGVEKQSDEYPDYFGQFTTILGNELLDILLSGNIEFFRALYAYYFVNCFIAFDKHKSFDLRASILLDYNYKIAVAPILELIDLSGYAKLMSEFHGKQELWSIVTATWDQHLEKPGVKLEFFVTAINLPQDYLLIMPRDNIKYAWLQKIERFLDVRVAKDKFYEKDSIYLVEPKTIALHSSPLVRIFAKHGYTHYDGIDIFIHSYFLDKDTSADFGRKGRNISTGIRSAEVVMQKYKEHKNEK